MVALALVFLVAVGAGALVRIMSIEVARSGAMMTALGVGICLLAAYVFRAVRRYKSAARRMPAVDIVDEVRRLREAQRADALPGKTTEAKVSSVPPGGSRPDANPPAPPDAPRSSDPRP